MWRVQPDNHEPTTNLGGSSRIHLQEYDRGSSSRRSTFDSRGIVFNPPEVILPALVPWIEQRNRASCLRIGSGGELPFSSVTRQTGERQIGKIGGPFIRARDDMIHGQVHHLGLLRQSAVFAAIASTGRHLPIQTLTHASHGQCPNSGNASVSRWSATSDFTFCSDRS